MTAGAALLAGMLHVQQEAAVVRLRDHCCSTCGCELWELAVLLCYQGAADAAQRLWASTRSFPLTFFLRVRVLRNPCHPVEVIRPYCGCQRLGIQPCP
jgi:hypothetical protein